MAISIADNFQYLGRKALDSRIIFDTVTAMVSTADSTIYDGCLGYVKANKAYYTYDAGNTVDATLGKWREFNPGEDLEEITALEVDTLWANN